MSAYETALDSRVTGRRIVATLVDGILFFGVLGFTGKALGMGGTDKMTGKDYGIDLLGFAVVALYYVIFEAAFGRTVGKMVTGIKVVSESTGNSPSVGQAIVRTVLRLIDGIAGDLIAFIVVLCNQRRQRLGDMAAKTRVVRA